MSAAAMRSKTLGLGTAPMSTATQLFCHSNTQLDQDMLGRVFIFGFASGTQVKIRALTTLETGASDRCHATVVALDVAVHVRGCGRSRMLVLFWFGRL